MCFTASVVLVLLKSVLCTTSWLLESAGDRFQREKLLPLSVDAQAHVLLYVTEHYRSFRHEAESLCYPISDQLLTLRSKQVIMLGARADVGVTPRTVQKIISVHVKMMRAEAHHESARRSPNGSGAPHLSSPDL